MNCALLQIVLLLATCAVLGKAQRAAIPGKMCQWDWANVRTTTYTRSLNFQQECAGYASLFNPNTCAVTYPANETMAFDNAVWPFQTAMRMHPYPYNETDSNLQLSIIAPMDDSSQVRDFFITGFFYVEKTSQFSKRQTLIGKSSYNSASLYIGLYQFSAAGRYDRLCFMRDPPYFIDIKGVQPMVCSDISVRAGEWNFFGLNWQYDSDYTSNALGTANVELFLNGVFQWVYTYGAPTIINWQDATWPPTNNPSWSDFSIGATNYCNTGCTLANGTACPASPKDLWTGLLAKLTYGRVFLTREQMMSLYREILPILPSSSSSSSSSTGMGGIVNASLLWSNVTSYCVWNFANSVAPSYKRGLAYPAECDSFVDIFNAGSCVIGVNELTPAFVPVGSGAFSTAMRVQTDFFLGSSSQGANQQLSFVAPADPDTPWTEFFINVWFYVENYSQLNGRQTILGKSSYNSIEHLYMGLYTQSGAGRYDQLCFMRDEPSTINTGTVPLICSTVSIAPFEWHMATIAWKRSDQDGNSTFALYLDAQLQGTYHYSSVSVVGFINGQTNLRPTAGSKGFTDFTLGASNTCGAPAYMFYGLLNKMIFAKTWPNVTLLQSLFEDPISLPPTPLLNITQPTVLSSSSSSSSSSTAVSSSISSSSSSSSSSEFSSSDSSSSSTGDSSSSDMSSSSSSDEFSSSSSSSDVVIESSSSSSTGPFNSTVIESSSDALPAAAIAAIVVGSALVVSVPAVFVYNWAVKQSTSAAMEAVKYAKLPRR